MSAILSESAVKLLERLCAAGDPWTWAIRCSGSDDYELRLEKSAPLDHAAFDELQRAGFLTGIPNGSGWWVSDEGRRAFIKSTDEMGDGKVHLLATCLNGDSNAPPVVGTDRS